MTKDFFTGLILCVLYLTSAIYLVCSFPIFYILFLSEGVIWRDLVLLPGTLIWCIVLIYQLFVFFVKIGKEHSNI